MCTNKAKTRFEVFVRKENRFFLDVLADDLIFGSECERRYDANCERNLLLPAVCVS